LTGSTQSVSTVHIVRQTLPLQAKLPQEVVAPGMQAPAPSQLPAAVMPLPGDVQEAVRQDMLAPTFTHPLAPHEPVLVRHPFGVVAHMASGPEVTSVQTPFMAPPRLQAWQAILQAVLQQTPSTQWFDVQSGSATQAKPSVSLSPQ
jgi:hypothetical protein